MSNDERKPQYDNTLRRIAELELDKYSKEDDAGVRYDLFRRFRQATQHLAPSFQADMFAEIWDSGRLAGYLQSQRGAHAKLEASFVGRLVNKMIEAKCPNPDCDRCNPSESDTTATTDKTPTWWN